MEEKRKKHKILWLLLGCFFVIMVAAALIFMRFGGFKTEKGTDLKELSEYAEAVEDIAVPEKARVIALGEATHGNSEFQQLKRDVFKVMVENYGVRAFALEGDFGGCEQVNRYIHGGEGTAEEAAAAIGFAIYRTDEMAELISYMREYNETAASGDDLRFYGFDMQRYFYSFSFLTEACSELGMDTAGLEKLMNGEEWSEEYDHAARKEIISDLKTELEGMENSEKAVHLAEMLLQNFELTEGTDESYALLRDGFMAKNVQWIAEQEEALGFERIFVSAHNGHIGKYASYDAMGKLLDDELGNKYYAIGTDFYKTNCNMPDSSGNRTNQVFYSDDPLAGAVKEAGLDLCWLDFSKVPENTDLGKQIYEYTYMGSLGESYSELMRLLPQSYRIFQPPATMYDGMIFVSDATPTVILEAN